MHELKFSGLSLNQGLDLKHELTELGLIINHDFEWYWRPYQTDEFQTIFRFKDHSLATFYQLKWA